LAGHLDLILPGGRFVTDGDSAVVVAARDTRPRGRYSSGAYQWCPAGQSRYSRLALADAQQRYHDVIGDFPA
jgi:hypothetical protein